MTERNLDFRAGQGEGNTYGGLLGRFPHDALRPQHPPTTKSVCTKSTRGFRVVHQSVKVIPDTLHDSRVPRHLVEHRTKHKMPPRAENFKKYRIHQKDNRPTVVDMANWKGTVRKSKFHLLRSPRRQTALSENSNRGKPPAKTGATQKVFSAERSSPRVEVVAQKHQTFLPNPSERSHNICDHGRFQTRLGSHDKQQKAMRKVDQNPDAVAQQPERVILGIRSDKRTGPRTKKPDSDAPERQQISGSLYNKGRGHQVSKTLQNYVRDFSSDKTVPDKPNSALSSRKIQLHSRQSITIQPTTRMVPESIRHASNLSETRHSSGGSVRELPLSCGGHICKRGRPGSQLPVCGCIQPTLEVQSRLVIPPSSAHTESPSTPRKELRNVSAGSPKMGENFLENRTKPTSNAPAADNTQPTQEPGRPENGKSPSGGKRPVFAGLEGSGWSRLIESWPEENRSLLENAWRKSTLKTYYSAWERWRLWTKTNNCRSDDPKAEDIAKYLCFLHRVLKLAPKTIAVHKSVAITFANPENSEILSNHPLIKHTLKGILASRPPPAKPHTWEVNQLIEFLKKYDINGNSLFQTSRHVAALLLLASGRRVHDLTLLDIDRSNLEIHENHIILWPKFGSKTDSNKHRQSGWKLYSCAGSLDYNIRLDVIFWVKKLICMTKCRRSDKITSLFISTRGKIKEASRSVIAGWLRTLFRDAGIEASPGSFRAAVNTDNWSNRNLNLDDVISRGNWKSKDTFLKYYYKDIKRNASESCSVNSLSKSFFPIL